MPLATTIELPLNERVSPTVSLLSRLLGKPGNSRDALRPLWDKTVALARQRQWYAELGVDDSKEGRFDAVTLVLCLVLLRMEREPALIPPSVLLTEIFIEDMDGQLREGGVGDLGVGKHIGKLMGVLGGRLGALREALAADDLRDVIARNLTLRAGMAPDGMAETAMALWSTLQGVSGRDILAGRF
jgi:cytochrome b pre-mRNA-processing protein 3